MIFVVLAVVQIVIRHLMGSGNVVVLFHALQNRNRKEESYHLLLPVCEESALCLPN